MQLHGSSLMKEMVMEHRTDRSYTYIRGEKRTKNQKLSKWDIKMNFFNITCTANNKME